MEKRANLFHTLNQRSLEIFKHVVDAYLETGEPIGSNTLAARLGMQLSSASIRSILSRLEEAGLLYSPHTSAGRLPTDAGLRFFVHGILKVGDLPPEERSWVEEGCRHQGLSTDSVLDQASRLLSGLSKCAGLVIAPKNDQNLKHMEFVHLGPGRALVVLVTDDGNIENRLIEIPLGLPASALIEATNYINAHFIGHALGDVKGRMETELLNHRQRLDNAVQDLVNAGIATWVQSEQESTLILNGQSHLLANVQHLDDLLHLKKLFDILETKEGLLTLLEASIMGDGVQIFIGAENTLFEVSGCSVIIAPYKNKVGKIIGSLGVVGPARLNYARIVPLVDYTAKVIGRIIE